MAFEDLVRKAVDHLTDNPQWWRGWRLALTIVVIALAGCYLAFCGNMGLGGG